MNLLWDARVRDIGRCLLLSGKASGGLARGSDGFLLTYLRTARALRPRSTVTDGLPGLTASGAYISLGGAQTKGASPRPAQSGQALSNVDAPAYVIGSSVGVARSVNVFPARNESTRAACQPA